MSVAELESRAPRMLRVGALPAAILAYAAAAAAIAPDKFTGVLLAYGQQIEVLPPLMLIGFGVAALIRRPAAPVSFAADLLRSRGVPLIAVVVCFWIGVSAFTTFKLSIPALVPFYADPMIAGLDAAIHGGADPYIALHALVPDWASWPLAYLYGIVWFVLWFGLVGYVALSQDRAFRRRYFWSLGLVLLIAGTLLATALSSVGPILYDRFYPGDRFAGLLASFEGTAVGDYMRLATGYLYANYLGGGHDLGTGISAMPSVHVAIATLNALMLSSRGRVAGTLGCLYAGVVLFESVYLGWHYALDGYVSIAVVSCIWWATGRIFAATADSEPSPRNHRASASR